MPRLHEKLEGLPCSNRGYALKDLDRPLCPECGEDYRAILARPVRGRSTLLARAGAAGQYWNTHKWIRLVVSFPVCFIVYNVVFLAGLRLLDTIDGFPSTPELNRMLGETISLTLMLGPPVVLAWFFTWKWSGGPNE